MSQAATQTISPEMREADWRQRWRDGHFFGLLSATSHLKLFLETTAVTFQGIAACVGIALAAIFADAVLALPPAGLVIADVVFISALAAALMLAVRQIYRNRFSAPRIARLLEDRLGIQNSIFINAVEFASATPRGDSPILRERAIRLAEERAFELSPRAALSFRPLCNAMAIALGALALFAAGWLLAPKAFGMILPRLLDPYGDHPPYTLVEFDVRITPEPVYHGKPATISVQLGGPELVEQAAVVFLDNDAREPTAMVPSGKSGFTLRIERAEVSRRFYIDTPNGRSESMNFTVVKVPFFEEAHVAYAYPEYTAWPPQENRLDGRGFRALVGTEVTLAVRSNIALRSGTLTLTPNHVDKHTPAPEGVKVELKPAPNDPQTVRGTFPIEWSGRYELKITSTEGADSLETLEGPVTAVADRLPNVSIVSPASFVAAVENWKVPVKIEALDDVGIQELRLYRGVNGWGPSQLELDFDRPQPNTARGATEFDLPALGARAGDIITYYVSAYDNHPSGKQFRDSETHVIQVISESEYQQFARQQYQMDEMIEELQAVRERLDRLEKEREELLSKLDELNKQRDSSAETTPEQQEQMKQLEQQLAKHAEGSQKLADDLKERAEQLKLYELEEPYLEQLKTMSEQLGQQAKNAEKLGKAMEQAQQAPSDAAAREALEKAEQQFREQNEPFSQQQKQQLNQTAQDLELFRQADSMLGAADRLRSIIQRQRELADRMAEFQNKSSLTPPDQARADRLAKDQELLEQDLQQAKEQLQKAAAEAKEKLPQMSASAEQLAQKIGDMKISEDQRSAAQQARAGAGEQSHQAAESAAQKLESLQSELGDTAGAAQGMSQFGDGPLGMPKDRIQQALQQLAQGRGVPGLGPSGSPSLGQQGGGGLGAGGQPGQEGTGRDGMPQFGAAQSFRGSQAPVSVLGPHTVQQGDRESPNGSLGGTGRGRWAPLGQEDAARAAEALNPDTREGTSSATGNLRGVPVPYRGEAEAYFRRMAEGK